MKVGIILYSQTGNTRSVANRLETALANAGHDVMLMEVMISGNAPNIELTEKPDPSPFDLVVFGGPVQGFDASLPMKRYLSAMPEMAGKRFICFATQQLPFKWMGGERSVRSMRKLAEDKGGHFVGHGVINWSRADRETRIERMLAHILRMIEIDLMD
jgi:flavodoxin